MAESKIDFSINPYLHSSARPTSPTKLSYGSTENIKSSYGFPVSELPGRDEKTRATVLVVEDDESHRIALNTLLERENYSVMTLADGREILSVIDKIKPDVILLDVMLPYLSGIEICQLIRENDSKIPIIMVSAKAEEVDIVLGMEMGADDYIAKPYRIRELIARINVLLRRRTARGDRDMKQAEDAPEEILCVGDVVLDQSTYEVTFAGRRLDLPLREFQLLRELLLAKGKVITRDELLLNIWGFSYEGDARIIATLISRLRSKIEKDPENPVRIVTVRGIGYRFDG